MSKRSKILENWPKYPLQWVSDGNMDLALLASQALHHADEIFILFLLILTVIVFLCNFFPTLVDVIGIILVTDGHRDDVALLYKF